jgi:hypothetical protein
MRNTTLTATLLLSLLAASGTAMVESLDMNHESMSGMHSMQPATAKANTGIGTVNRVDQQSWHYQLDPWPDQDVGLAGHDHGLHGKGQGYSEWNRSRAESGI